MTTGVTNLRYGCSRTLGLLLPCNVTVRRVEGHTQVSAIDADAMVSVTGNDELKPIAEEANTRLRAALQGL